MFEYELQQMRSAELIREAHDHRLAKEALQDRRATRRAARRAAHNDTEGQVHNSHPRRHRFTRAA
ncbi:hypothetical protein [Streptomyces sp. NPDC002580]|jgi:hypothetical protein|uniref:hypothetical protein n=1 Tax=Streptomyces sp. NPDC002580 TaxID=3364653 RepID=UPI0036835413